MKLIYLIGASGSGKTSVAARLAALSRPYIRVCHFDSVGVPSHEEMVRLYGSAEEWQRAQTIAWARHINEHSEETVVLEGQTRPSFIEEAGSISGVPAYRVVLLDCNDQVRRARLIQRGQVALASGEMASWARYLREECFTRAIPVIDTSLLTVDETLVQLQSYL